MADRIVWRDGFRPVTQIGLLLAGCLVTVWVRQTVDADTLSESGDLLIQFCALLTLAVAGIVAILSARFETQRAKRLLFRAVPAGLCVVALTFASASYSDVSIELESLIQAGQSSAPDTTIVLGPGGDNVRLSGEIRDGAARHLDALLDANPSVTRVHLTSEGGLAEEGQAIGDVIAARKLITYVPDYCVSACTLAFVRGRERLFMENARIGFHGPYEEGLFGATFKGDATVQRAAYVAAGISDDFVDQALRFGAADLWYPEAARLIAAHVATGKVDRFRFPDSNLDGSVTIDGARETILRNFPILKAFAAERPRVVDAVAAWYLAAYKRGRSEGQVVDDLRAIVSGATTAVIARADDQTVVGVARFLAAAMRQAGSGPACVEIGTQADLLTAAMLLGTVDGQAGDTAVALVAKALKGGDGAPVEAPSHAVTTISLESARVGCPDVRRAYADVLRRPAREAAGTIRPMLAQLAHQSAERLAVLARPDR